MAEQFGAGFGGYDGGDILRDYTSGSAASIGAFGPNGESMARNLNLLYKYLPNVSSATFVIGAKIIFRDIAGGTSRPFDIMKGSTRQLEFAITTSGKIEVVDHDGITYLSSLVLVDDIEYAIEFKGVVDDAAGSFEVRVNKTTVLSASGIDTQAGSSSGWDGFRHTGVFDIRDVYVLDGSGGRLNDFLTTWTTATLFAQSGNGFNTGLTPSTGSNHGALVDDTTPDDDTTYNKATAIDLKDTYALGSLTSTGQIYFIQPMNCVRKSEHGTRKYARVLRFANFDYEGADVPVAVDYSYPTEPIGLNPLTGLPFTPADSLQLGAKSRSGATTATRFYLTAHTAPYTPATIRGAWDQTTGSVTRALDSQKDVGGGENTAVQVSETNASTTFDVLLYRGVSGPLKAQTIAGTINVCLPISESQASANMFWHLHIYVTQGDSDTPRGTLLTDYVEATNELPSAAHTFHALASAQTLSSLAIQDGDRLVVEIGYISTEATAVSRNANLRYGVLNPTTHVVLADGFVGSTETTTRAGFIEFSQAIEESTALEFRITQSFLQVIMADVPAVEEPGGGGDPGTGTDPDDDESICGENSIFDFIRLQTSAGEMVCGKMDLSIGNEFIDGRLLSISPFTRALSNPSFRMSTATTTIRLSNRDNALSAVADSLLDRRCDLFFQSARQMRLGLTPRREMSFVVRDFDADSEGEFTLYCEDQFASLVGEVKAKQLQPQRVFRAFDTASDFPNLPFDLNAKAVPIIYGKVSDEAFGTPTGVVPAIFVGSRRLSDGLDWDEYVLCGHAIKSVLSWFASDLAPETPTRVKMPTSTEGTEFLIPGSAGWTSVVGANPYVDYNGNRYTVIFARGARSEAAKNGTVPIAVNVAGIEDVGNGSGAMIDAAPFVIQHFIANFVLQNYTSGAWSIPTINGYSQLKTSTFAECVDIAADRISGGYNFAWYLGEDGAQQSTDEVLVMLQQNCDLNLGTDRHGRVLASMVDSGGSPQADFLDVTDIVEKSFLPKRRAEWLANMFLFSYRRRLMSLDFTAGPPATYAQNHTNDWLVDGQWFRDSFSVSQHGERRETINFYAVRETATADNVTATIWTRRYLGPEYARFKSGPCASDLEIGQNYRNTHYAGFALAGDVNKLRRLERLTCAPDELTWELEGQAI